MLDARPSLRFQQVFQLACSGRQGSLCCGLGVHALLILQHACSQEKGLSVHVRDAAKAQAQSALGLEVSSRAWILSLALQHRNKWDLCSSRPQNCGTCRDEGSANLQHSCPLPKCLSWASATPSNRVSLWGLRSVTHMVVGKLLSCWNQEQLVPPAEAEHPTPLGPR